jgi:hypothetical protein
MNDETTSLAMSLIDSYLAGSVSDDDVGRWARERLMDDTATPDERLDHTLIMLATLDPEEPEDFRCSKDDIERARRVLLGLEPARPIPGGNPPRGPRLP